MVWPGCRAKLDQLEEKQAEVEDYKRRLERLQRDSDERLQGTATELRRLQLEKTMLQVGHRGCLLYMPLWALSDHLSEFILRISKSSGYDEQTHRTRYLFYAP